MLFLTSMSPHLALTSSKLCMLRSWFWRPSVSNAAPLSESSLHVLKSSDCTLRQGTEFLLPSDVWLVKWRLWRALHRFILLTDRPFVASLTKAIVRLHDLGCISTERGSQAAQESSPLHAAGQSIFPPWRLCAEPRGKEWEPSSSEVIRCLPRHALHCHRRF